MRERKFSGVGSGTKFANELERKQKTCWFRGALDTNDVKAIDAYNGDDDMPAWKRQLLARLKSNENSSGNYCVLIYSTSSICLHLKMLF